MAERAFTVLGIVAAVLAMLLAARFVVADKTPKSYYLQSNVSGSYCVMQFADWAVDEEAFCSDDIDKLLRVLAELNNKPLVEEVVEEDKEVKE